MEGQGEGPVMELMWCSHGPCARVMKLTHTGLVLMFAKEEPWALSASGRASVCQPLKPS